MYCAQCGTINQNNADTCELCGSLLNAPSGSEACSTCGSPVGDLDQYCRSCGAQQGSDPVSATTFGPSFLEDDQLNVDLGQLPSWLQELSGTAQPPSTPGGGMAGGPSAGTGAVGMPQPLLNEARPDTFLGESPSGGGGADGGLSLLGEDDLPDWLRALGESEESQPVPAAAPPQQQEVPEILSAVPTVSRAWLERGSPMSRDRVAATRTDFTLPTATPSSVSSSGAADDAAPAAPPAPKGGGRSRGWGRPKPKKPAKESLRQEITPLTVSPAKAESAAKGGNLLRLVLLVLIVLALLALVAYVVLMGNLADLQGML